MEDRLRALLDLVLASLDEPGTDGRDLARRAHFSRDHLDRLLAAATGETPVGLRRRLLLERAAWQLRTERAAPSELVRQAGYGSLAAFSRAFARAYGVAPSAFAASDRPLHVEAPNGVHFHPPAGIVVPGTRGPDVADRLLGHHLARTRTLLEAAARLPAGALERPLRPGLVLVWFEGEEPSAAAMAERLVYTLEVWVAAMAGTEAPQPGAGDLLPRFDRAAEAFAGLARGLAARGAWGDAFVDALCEPPESFTYGSVLAHVLSFGAVRREALAAVLAELGADVDMEGADPIMWERARP
jgi:AraC-like DNA-binding protein